MGELKKHLMFIDKTNWFFEKDTVDFTSHIPYNINLSWPLYRFETDSTLLMKQTLGA